MYCGKLQLRNTVFDKCEDHVCSVQPPVDEIHGETEEEVIAHKLENDDKK
jgi:hypothetical protein